MSLTTVNAMTPEQIDAICTFMITTDIPKKGLRYVYQGNRGWKCNLSPTRKPNGGYKYPQIDCNRWVPGAGKQLVHAIWWRYQNSGNTTTTTTTTVGLELSHIDSNPKYIECRAETHEYNESRKYCHLFGWYKVLPGEDAVRCPHWEHFCTGPLRNK